VDGSADRRQARVLRTAVGFAFGHAAVLGVGALLPSPPACWLPAVVSSGAERAGGAMLVAMGAFGLWTLTSGRAYGHIHTTPESGLHGSLAHASVARHRSSRAHAWPGSDARGHRRAVRGEQPAAPSCCCSR
jgi:hypothetical protein